MTNTFEDTTCARESILERKDQIRLFDFDKAATEGNRLNNLTAATYKMFNGIDSYERHYLAAAFIEFISKGVEIDIKVA